MMGGGRGVVISKITSIHDNNPPPQHPTPKNEVKDGHQSMVKDIVENIIMKCMERSPADPGTEVGLGSGCSMVGGARPKIRPTQPDLHSYKGVENKANSATTPKQAKKPISKSKNKNSVKNIIDFFKREESVGNKVNLAESRKPPILPTLGERIPDKKSLSLSSVKPKPNLRLITTQILSLIRTANHHHHPRKYHHPI